MSQKGGRSPEVPGTSGDPPDPPIKRKNSQEMESEKKRGRGRPRKNNNNTPTPTVSTEYQSVNDDGESLSGVSTNNSFSGLEDDDMGDFVPVNHRNRKQRNPGIKRPPPIVIPNVSLNIIEEKLKSGTIPSENIYRKITLQGTKLFVKSKEEFKVLESYLAAQNIQSFSYTQEENLTSKFVLKKLPNLDIEALRVEITKHNLNPVDIKKFRIKNPKYDGQMHYLLYFKKSERVSLSTLKSTITGLFNYIVHFEAYRPNTFGPTQCRNCQAYGHSSNNCRLSPKCVRCSGPHKSKDCDIVDKTTNKIPDDKRKCANCSENHTANYSKCSERGKIIKQKEERQKAARSGFRPQRFPTSNYQRSFPSLTQPSFSSILKVSPPSTSDLFTPEELLKIFVEIVEISKDCKSKTEQIMSLAKIFEKFVSNSNP